MNRLLSLSLLGTALFHLQAGAQDAAEFPTLGEILPAKDVVASLMSIQPDARAGELSQKMQAALAEKKDWLQEYLKKNAEVRPLPWHANFGLTEAEYKEMLELSKKMTLVEAAKVKLSVKREGKVVTLGFGSADPAVQPLKFNLDDLTVTLPVAKLEKPSQRNSGPQHGLLGPHRSFDWALYEGDNEKDPDWTRITLSLGEILESKKRFFRYRLFINEKGKPKSRMELLLVLPAPDAAAGGEDKPKE